MGNSQPEEDAVLSDSFCFVPKPISDETRAKRNHRMNASIVLQSMAEQNTSLGHWLLGIRKTTDVECLNALHAKEVAETTDLRQALAVRCAQVAIRNIRELSIEIIDGLDILIDLMPIKLIDLQNFGFDFRTIHRNIIEIIGNVRSEICSQAKILSEELNSTCEVIKVLIQDSELKKTINNPSLESYLRKIKELLGGLVDNVIKKECQTIFNGLYAPKDGICLKWTLLALKSITNSDAYICRIFAENSSLIRKLIELLSSNLTVSGCHSPTMLRTTALRILYYLCINPEAIRLIYQYLDMEKHITLVLQSERNESILKEMAGLLVPLTTPFIEHRKNYRSDKGLINFIRNREDLVHSFLRVISTTKSIEVFLLVTWSLANISFYDSKLMIKNDVLSILITKTRKGGIFQDDIAVKDQVLTIIANISQISPIEIVRASGLVYLISAIQIRPVSNSQDDGEAAIIERMQKKVATALTRLAINHKIASLIYRYRGCHRLVEICRNPSERNNSDAVLVAVLIALRRIYSALDNTIYLEQLDAEDLIHLSFEEAFRKYSSSNHATHVTSDSSPHSKTKIETDQNSSSGSLSPE
ncbi:protein inscuteable homolog [Brevipalpus obovatus]|uniref:protein inscuteable homolog n=1 Tax=Brevipalpus obovatus TaxID=246614 RepID=UPI003D9F21A3